MVDINKGKEKKILFIRIKRMTFFVKKKCTKKKISGYVNLVQYNILISKTRLGCKMLYISDIVTYDPRLQILKANLIRYHIYNCNIVSKK